MLAPAALGCYILILPYADADLCALLQRHGLCLSDLAAHDAAADFLLLSEQQQSLEAELAEEIQRLEEEKAQAEGEMHRWGGRGRVAESEASR